MTQHRIKPSLRKRQGLICAFTAMFCLMAAGPALAQLGSRLGPVLGLPLGPPSVSSLPGQVEGDAAIAADTGGKIVSRLEQMRSLVREHPRALDTDAAGNAVVRGVVIALDPSPASLAIARRAGFEVSAPETLHGLDLTTVTLRAPGALSTRAAIARLRTLDPNGRYDFDHLYSGAGTARTADDAAAVARREPVGRMIGLIDTGVASDHPAFGGTTVLQQGFAPGGVRPATHGTAVASLLVRQAVHDQNNVVGPRLFAADVYGDGPTGGSADAIVHAMAWLGRADVPVINVSLVGPPNLLMEAAVRSLVSRGVLIVAPVGNDGPAAPPAYPAAYPGVIAVTAVDARRRVLPEAGRGSHLDFAAPGANVRVARPGGGYVTVRGTSFAAPIVAGELALLISVPDRTRAAQAVQVLAAESEKAGAGDFGKGLVGESPDPHSRSWDR